VEKEAVTLRLINAAKNQPNAAKNNRRKNDRPGCPAVFLRVHTMLNL
jgi:hypothetical protein